MSGILQGLLASVGGASGPWLYAWGLNSVGQLGDNTVVAKSSPVQIGSETTWSKIAGGNNFSTAIKTDGTLWSWGQNDNGQLGLNISFALRRSSPVQVGALTTWSKLGTGSSTTTCGAIKTDGTLWMWGYNKYCGTVGDNTTVNRSSPVQIGNLTTWSELSLGYRFTHAIKTDGTLWAWGINFNGMLGDDSRVYRSSPVQIGALTNWSKVSGGGNFAAAVKTDGTMWTWGNNNQGQLGLNISDSFARSSPVQVGALTNWSQVSCGYRGCLAIKTDGTLWSWGRNQYGQLGDNTLTNRSSPVQIGSATDWSQISSGNSFSVATKTNKTIWAWGRNYYGNIGDNSQVYRSSPVQVGSNTWAAIATLQQSTLAIED